MMFILVGSIILGWVPLLATMPATGLLDDRPSPESGNVIGHARRVWTWKWGHCRPARAGRVLSAGKARR